MCLIYLILLFNLFISSIYSSADIFTENLFIKPLSTGHVYAHFEFKTLYNKNLISLNYENHFDLFPVEISKLIIEKRIEELQFSLTKNGWKTKQWQYPFRDTSSGFEINLWLSESVLKPDKNYKEITNYLSGKFCASISSIDKTVSVSPKHLLQPKFNQRNLTNNYYSSIPHETVCTENLTPWKKLLPCYSKAGLSSLLNSAFILNSNYFSISVDLEQFCLNESCEEKGIALKQTVSIVFNPLIKSLNKQSWSLIKLFGLSVRKPCWLASESRILIDITHNRTDNPNMLSPAQEKVIEKNELYDKQKYAIYDIKEFFKSNPNATKFNVASIYKKEHNHQVNQLSIAPIHANRFFIDNGFFNGEINCKITNNLDRSVEIIYFETLPWRVRFYLHTLKIESNKILTDKSGSETNSNKEFTSISQSLLHYQPGKYKEKPYHLELKLKLPPKSVTTISFDVDKVFLKWTEYPPDANHGIYISSSIIQVLDKKNKFRITTEPLLIGLPTPDFSMPYNVICLVSTVISLCFSPIHNFSTRFVDILKSKKE